MVAVSPQGLRPPLPATVTGYRTGASVHRCIGADDRGQCSDQSRGSASAIRPVSLVGLTPGSTRRDYRAISPASSVSDAGRNSHASSDTQIDRRPDRRSALWVCPWISHWPRSGSWYWSNCLREKRSGVP